ncbi:unnamed protein product [Bubo scandiacus]
MAAPSGPAGFQFAIDRGGTFTDVFARCPGGRVRVLKLLSEDPAYGDAPTEGIRRVLQEERGGAGAAGPAPGHLRHRVDPHGHHGGHQRAAGAPGRAPGPAGHPRLPRPPAHRHPGPATHLRPGGGGAGGAVRGGDRGGRAADPAPARLPPPGEGNPPAARRLHGDIPAGAAAAGAVGAAAGAGAGAGTRHPQPGRAAAPLLRLARPRGAGRGAGAGVGLPARVAVVGGGRDGAGGAARVHGLRRRLPHPLHPALPGQLPPRLRPAAAGGAGAVHALGRGPDPDAALQRGPRHPLGAGRRRGGLRRHHLRPPRRAARHRLRHGRGPVDRHPTPTCAWAACSPTGAGSRRPLSVEEVAMGFVRVANEAMCRPIRALTQARGHDAARHVLACFGGAGGQHACAIARALGMSRVFIHKYSGVLSAYGLALADVVHEAQAPCALRYEPAAFARLDGRIAALQRECRDALRAQGFAGEQIRTEAFLHLRYEGTDCALMCSAKGHPPTPGSCRAGDFLTAFTSRYLLEFGFTIPDRPVVVDDVRVRGTGSSGVSCDTPLAPSGKPARVETVTRCYFEEGYLETPVFLLEELACDHLVPGPAIIIDKNSTIVVEPGCTASLTRFGDVSITVGSGPPRPVGPQLDAVQLSIFSHRFMSIAEQMGRILQRTAISTNIKERLDFSCALFGAGRGAGVQRPPHPRPPGRHAGDRPVPATTPARGGSHLPDLTVITPVFWPGVPKPVFFVASRGHHADIGGVTPGSMPPHSKALREEGAVFVSFKLVKDGVFQEEAVTEALMAPGRVPGCSGTRNLPDNLSDLRAQVAANQKGIQLVTELIRLHGLAAVQAYMAHIQANAEVAVREMLKGFAARWGTALEAEDRMDDGSPIRLRVQVDPQEGSAVFDFSGSGPEVYGNCNAPRAITLSALIYCLRCMVGQDIPLNQGCLAPVRVVIPKGSILDPSPEAAVVGGNVLTSQRVVDVIFRAFGVCAASQGCMNNVTFGNERVGYYETVAGGAGAGPTLARPRRRPHAHDQHPHHRPRDPGAAVPRGPAALRAAPGFGGRGALPGGGGSPGAPGLNLLLRRDGPDHQPGRQDLGDGGARG